MSSQDPSPPAEAAQSVCPKWVSRWVWQLIILVSGGVTILVGIVLLPAPGPGSLVIYAGIGILATEFIWARQVFHWIRDKARQLILRIRVWVKQVWRRRS